MEMMIDFPGGAQVDAHFGPYTVSTDQPPSGGGTASAPTPFELFLSSIGTCAGIYVLGFCRQRNLPTDGIQIKESVHRNPDTHLVDTIDLQIQVPPGFPEKYYDSLVRAAQLCAVKKALENPPTFNVYTQVVAPAN